MSNKDESFIASLVEAAIFGIAAYGIIWISYWSFNQTRAFFQSAMAGDDSSLAWALFFQYGQNVFLFLASRIGNRQVQITPKMSFPLGSFFMGMFGLFCAIDAGTNVGEWRRENPEIASNVNVYSILMYPSLIVIVFVEEIGIYVLSGFAHKLNDLLDTMGFGRIGLLDTFGGSQGQRPPFPK